MIMRGKQGIAFFHIVSFFTILNFIIIWVLCKCIVLYSPIVILLQLGSTNLCLIWITIPACRA